jgi:hypothetical protein
MKPLVLIIALSLALSVSMMAQSQEKEKASKTKDASQLSGTEKQNAKKELKGFVDTDGDGIDDRKLKTLDTEPGTPKRTRKRDRKRDHFIDSDGDGINDNRCNGLGFGSKGRHRKGGRK